MAMFNFGQTANKFLPWNPPKQQQQLAVNRFDPNVLLPGSNQTAIGAPPPRPTAPSLSEAYARISANRPNRMAYEEAVQQGTPQIERGKWAKLGALLAAGGTSLGQNSAEAGMRLGLSAYNEPQRKANEEYDKKMFGLERMASMEDTDVARQLEVAKAENEDFYRKEAASTDRARFGLDYAQAGRQEEMQKVQIRQAENEMRIANTERWTNPNTGISFKKVDGVTSEVAKTDLTPEEKAAFEGAQERAREAAREPGRAADRRSAEGIARANQEAITARNDEDNETRRMATYVSLMEKAKALPEDEIGKRLYTDMALEVNTRQLPADAAEFLVIENGVPVARRPAWRLPTEKNKVIEDAVTAFIARSLQRSREIGRGAVISPNPRPGSTNVGPNPLGGEAPPARREQPLPNSGRTSDGIEYTIK